MVAGHGSAVMRHGIRGFTLVEILIVMVIVGILALAAIPLMINNTQDARRAEAERLLGAARDFSRAQYASTSDVTEAATLIQAEIANGSFSGNYFNVTTFNNSSSVSGMDANLTTDSTPDGQGAIDFAWESGKSEINWS